MKQINYILVNETYNKDAARAISDSKLPGIRHHVVVNANAGIKEQRQKLHEELVRLRKKHPDAKILGLSELGDHCVHPTERMNQLRKKLSEYP